MHRQFGGALVVSCTLLLAACGSRSPTIHLAVAKAPMTYLPVYLAQSLGYFTQEGLNIEIQDFAGGAKSIEAVLGGSAEVAAGYYEHAIQMAAEGRPFQSFVTMLRYPGMALVVAPPAAGRIRRVEDLRSAKVGVGTPGSPTHFFLNYLLLKHGVPLDQVSVIGIGPPATAAASLEHGQVDAAVVGGALTILQTRFPGLTVLAESFSAQGVKDALDVAEYPGATLLARSDWLARNGDTARRMTRAILHSLHWIHGHSPEEIRARMPEGLRMPDAQTDLEALRLFLPMFSTDGRMTPEGAEAVKKVLSASIEKVRAANVDVSKTYTNEFLADH